MGQYYKPIILNQKNKPMVSFCCYDFGSGAKLMEHSWMKSDFVRFVELHLMNSPQKIVWAGDYANGEDTSTFTDMEVKTLLSMCHSKITKEQLLQDDINLYMLADCVGKLTHDENVKDKYSHEFKIIAPLSAKYIINHDKKEFVDKSKVPDVNGWKIHPLPLLTCEGNGRGGGDFKGDSKLVGSWARNLIEISTKKSTIPKDYKEIIFDLVER